MEGGKVVPKYTCGRCAVSEHAFAAVVEDAEHVPPTGTKANVFAKPNADSTNSLRIKVRMSGHADEKLLGMQQLTRAAASGETSEAYKEKPLETMRLAIEEQKKISVFHH